MDQDFKRAVRNYLQAAIDRVGERDPTSLARKIGLSPSTLTRAFQPDWDGGIRLATLEKVARKTGIPVPPELQAARKKPYIARRPDGGGAFMEARPAAYVARDMRDLIPVRSAARGGDEQEMLLEDGPIGFVPRPHVLDGVKEAYAIYMVGDSMSPRYEPGYTLYVNPFKPARPGRGVVLYKKNNAVLVKRFKRATDKVVVLEQLNPPREIQIPRSDIREMHLIVHVDEES